MTNISGLRSRRSRRQYGFRSRRASGPLADLVGNAPGLLVAPVVERDRSAAARASSAPASSAAPRSSVAGLPAGGERVAAEERRVERHARPAAPAIRRGCAVEQRERGEVADVVLDHSLDDSDCPGPRPARSPSRHASRTDSRVPDVVRDDIAIGRERHDVAARSAPPLPRLQREARATAGPRASASAHRGGRGCGTAAADVGT